MQARLRTLSREDRVRRVRIFAHEGDIGRARLRVLPEMRRRIDDVALPADRVRVVHHTVATREQPVGEVEILVPVASTGGEPFIEPAEPREQLAPDRELPGENLVEPRFVPGLGHPARLGVGPHARAAREQVRWRIRMQRHDAGHRVRARLVIPVVLGEQPGVGLHVVVEKEQDVAGRLRRAAVARARRSTIWLREHAHGERGRERAEGIDGTIGRAIHDDDRLERLAVSLPLERLDEPDHQRATLEGRHDHGETQLHAHTWRSRRAIAPPSSASTPLHHSAVHTTSQSR